jgi:hypothetical protein
MTVISLWVGALSHGGARVRAKLSGVTSARLAVDTDAAFSAPVFFGPASPTGDGVVSIDASGLDPGGTYVFAIEEDSVLNTGTTGRFRTAPVPAGQPASFSFIASGDAGLTPDFPDTTGLVLASARISNAPTFDTIREHPSDPLFFMHLGDLHYYDLGSGSHGIVGGGSLGNYRRAIDDVLLQSRQHELYRSVPLVYMWDDHDFGPNNSDGTLSTKGNAATAYRERVPSYALPDPGAAYQSFPIGRVLFVVLDTRFYRSPNGAADGPSKTMLGSNQKAWLAQLLSESTAEVMVMVSSVRWINGSSDSWPGFATERQEIADLLVSTGWADRMVMINADVHALAFDSGANNDWGGFPVYVVGSVDATPFSPTPSSYDRGASVERDQYGGFQVTDNGASITITAQGYLGTTAVISHTFVIGATDPEPPPPPAPPAGLPTVAVATVRSRVVWLGCDLVSGRMIAQLHDVAATPSRVLGAYTSTEAVLPIPLGGPAALGPLAFQATEPPRTMLVLVVNDLPVYAGIPLPREGGTDPTLQLGLMSIEGYLEHRFVRDHVWVQQDEASVIAAGLFADAAALPGIGGEGIGLIVDAPPTGTRRDRTYKASDHKSVYESLQELMAVEGGPEWTIDLDWADAAARNTVSKIARVRPRIGVAASQPSALFVTTARSVYGSTGQANARYRYKEDFGGGRYANVVQAYSSGEGDDQPHSDLAVDTAALAAGVPIWERHYQPSSSITNLATLNAHARAELGRRRLGSRLWAIEARWDATPRYGIDWRLGDDVAWHLVGHRHPDGVRGQGRAVGFELDTARGVIVPILEGEE